MLGLLRLLRFVFLFDVRMFCCLFVCVCVCVKVVVVSKLFAAVVLVPLQMFLLDLVVHAMSRHEAECVCVRVCVCVRA